MIVFEGFTPDSFVDFMRASYGPVLRVFARIADDPARVAELDAALRALRARPRPRDARHAAARGRVPAHVAQPRLGCTRDR